jgi:hypothetical protein
VEAIATAVAFNFMRLSFCGALLLLPAIAFGQPQVSAADKAAARDLFNDGYALQQQGKFSEALDRFQRSYDTFNAPTTALHVAECQAALLRLVDAAETYRGVARMELDASSPEAYKQARDQAQAELAQIEPRIPHLTIKVNPANAPGLLVTLDGQTVKPALVGVARPINPGVHKITAVASGYLQAEQTIDVKERTTPSIPINLQPGGVVYTPTTNPNPNPNPNPTGPPNTYTPPSPNPTPNPGNPNNTQFQGGFQTEWQVPTRQYSRMSFIFGADLAAIIPTGDIQNQRQFSSYAGAGFGVGANIAFRFARYFLIGGYLGGGGLGAGNGTSSGSGTSGDALQTNGWSTFWIGPYLAYIGNPEGFGFYGELGGNYRSIGTTPNTSLPSNEIIRDSYSGGEFMLGLGFHIRAGTYIRLMPKIQMMVGSFDKASNTAITSGSQVHAFFNFGLSGFFDLDIDKPKPTPGNTAGQ